ncbi:MAG: hypothetical protein LBT40_13290 [Deltaproteobacteria bacterium]|nr:hypothetical protein [Deltaproteobacteria bacterium]
MPGGGRSGRSEPVRDRRLRSRESQAHGGRTAGSDGTERTRRAPFRLGALAGGSRRRSGGPDVRDQAVAGKG